MDVNAVLLEMILNLQLQIVQQDVSLLTMIIEESWGLEIS